MTTHTRPHRHLRRVRTKHGRRTRLINPHIHRRTYGAVATVAHMTRRPPAKISEEIADTIRRQELYRQEGDQEALDLTASYLQRLQKVHPAQYTKVTDDLLIDQMTPPPPKRLIFRQNFSAVPLPKLHENWEKLRAKLYIETPAATLPERVPFPVHTFEWTPPQTPAYTNSSIPAMHAQRAIRVKRKSYGQDMVSAHGRQSRRY